MTLTEFLLARIAEDEEGIRDARITDCPEWWMPDAWSRDRALAECEAKRRIVHLHSGPDYWESPDYHLCVDSMTHNDKCETLRALARPYAAHPDYDQAWAA